MLNNKYKICINKNVSATNYSQSEYSSNALIEKESGAVLILNSPADEKSFLIKTCDSHSSTKYINKVNIDNIDIKNIKNKLPKGIQSDIEVIKNNEFLNDRYSYIGISYLGNPNNNINNGYTHWGEFVRH